MKAGKNVWVCEYCRKEFKGPKDGSRPDRCPDTECKCECFAPKYPLKRVKRGAYQYYTGRDDWSRMANLWMKSDAQSKMRHW